MTETERTTQAISRFDGRCRFRRTIGNVRDTPEQKLGHAINDGDDLPADKKPMMKEKEKKGKYQTTDNSKTYVLARGSYT